MILCMGMNIYMEIIFEGKFVDIYIYIGIGMDMRVLIFFEILQNFVVNFEMNAVIFKI